jgi:phosphoglycolate phosphatase-like HAD superfamily hydrolase
VAHLVWDWNGTLLDDNHAVMAGVNAVCAAFGRDAIELDYWRSIYRRPLTDCYTDLLRRALSEQDWAEIDRFYHDTYRELLHTCRLAPGVPDELHRWRAAGRSQSLLSMWFHHELVPLVTELQLAELFGRIDGLRIAVGGGSKTEHLVEHLAAQRLDPADVVLIGDALDDAVAARAVGARCVLVTTGVTSRAQLRDADVPVADSVPDALLQVASW